MNPEQMPMRGSEGIDTGLESMEHLDFNELHTLGEKLESDSFTLQKDLQETVESIPEGTSERAEADSILDSFRHALGKKLQIGIALLTITTPFVTQAEEQVHEPNIEDTTQLEFNESRTTERILKKLHEGVWNDNHETLYVQFGMAENEKKIFRATASPGVEGDVESGNFQVGDISPKQHYKLGKRLDEAWYKQELSESRMIKQHNHPIEMLAKTREISEEHLESMRSGEGPVLVAPPSVLDLYSVTGDYLGVQFDIVGQVAEPSGTWTFSHIEGHPVSEAFYESRRVSMENLMNSFETRDNPQSNTEVNGFFKWFFAQDSIQAEILEETAQEKSGISYSDTFITLWETAEAIRTQSQAGEDVSNLIERYIDLAGTLGIAVEYEQNNTTEKD